MYLLIFLIYYFVIKLILVSFTFSFFCPMVVVTIKEAQLIFVVDNLNFRIRNVVFEANVFNRYGTFD